LFPGRLVFGDSAITQCQVGRGFVDIGYCNGESFFVIETAVIGSTYPDTVGRLGLVIEDSP